MPNVPVFSFMSFNLSELITNNASDYCEINNFKFVSQWMIEGKMNIIPHTEGFTIFDRGNGMAEIEYSELESTKFVYIKYEGKYETLFSGPVMQVYQPKKYEKVNGVPFMAYNNLNAYINMSDTAKEYEFEIPKAIDPDVNDTITFKIKKQPNYLTFDNVTRTIKVIKELVPPG